MKIKHVLPAILMLLFLSCNRRGKEFEYADGKLSYSLTSNLLMDGISSVSDYNSQLILNQIYEGLISLNSSDLTPEPQLAKDFKIKEGGLLYEFELRNDVFFIRPNGERIPFSPEDVIYSIKKACTFKDSAHSRAFFLVFQNNLLGADAFFAKTAEDIDGLTVKGNVVSMRLLRPDNNFLSRLALPFCAMLSKEIDPKSTEFCGTGPFVLQPKNLTKDKITLLRNEDYYQQDAAGCRLPYLSELEFVVHTSKMEQLRAFENGETQIITGLPTNRITQMLEGRKSDFNSIPPLFILHNNPQLVSNYYVFNLQDPRFQDQRVRQAFNLAINRKKLGIQVLRNQYYELGFYGVVPPVKSLFRGYDFEGIRKKGFDLNPEKAKELLAAAGYPNGENFGSVTLRFDIDDIHSAVANEIAKQLRNVLGINVNIDGSTFDQLTKDASNGEGDIFRLAWAADYPSAESFLMNFYGKFVPLNVNQPSPINFGRYQNKSFDDLIDKAKAESNIVKRRSLFADAEKILIQDAPIMPLWYSGQIQIVYSHVRNIHFNPLDQFIFKAVYLKEWTKEEYLNSMKK